MTNRDDLIDLLNRIKLDEMVKKGAASQFNPSTMRHVINLYCNPNNDFHRYDKFKIRKKSGGFRQIAAPWSPSFTSLLRFVNEIFKAVYSPSDYAMGFAEHRSVVTNASVHTGQNYILNIDLKDFFPSIEQPRIWKRLQLEPFNFPKPVANVLAGLCSIKETRVMEDGTEKNFYVLPQGAPTSPIITNMICDKLDRRLAGLAKRFGLNYTRYADDISFSSMHNVYQEGSDFNKELERIIQGQGFSINEKKTRLQKTGSRQEVTGIIVSHKLNVTQKYVRDIRNILYIWDRYGYNTAYAKFLPKYKEANGHVKKGVPDLLRVLDGKLKYLGMVKGRDDSVYRRLQAKFEKLASQTRDPRKATPHSITYVETCFLPDFEKKYGTEIIFARTDSKRGIDHGNVSGNDAAARTQPHRYAYFNLGGKKILASVHRDVSPEMEKRKEMLAISTCRDKSDKPFWLIHHKEKVTVPPPKPVDWDSLGNDLDYLLSRV